MFLPKSAMKGLVQHQVYARPHLTATADAAKGRRGSQDNQANKARERPGQRCRLIRKTPPRESAKIHRAGARPEQKGNRIMAQRKRSSLGSVKMDSKGVWRVRVDLGRDPLTGKRRSREKRVRGSRREAEAELARMLVEAGQAPARASGVLRGDYIDGVYMPSARERLRPDTVAGYESDAELYIKPVLGRVALDDLDAAMVEAMLRGVEAPGARLSAYKTLRQVLRHARAHRAITWVATDAVEMPKVPHYEPAVLDAKQAARVLEAFRDDPIEAAVLVALGCGLRRSEICGLDWEDVDLGALTLRVRSPYVFVKGKGYEQDPKTPTSRRVVSIPASFADRLAEIRPQGATGPVLKGKDGERMHPDAVSHRYARVCKAAGCHWTSLKNLRHSHATIMLEAGVDVVTVSRRLGHASVSTTDRFYLRPRRAADVGAADAFDSLGVL